jgi:tocopherol O-methyltransferase
MDNSLHSEKVIRHYKVNQIIFTLLWSRNYLRYGLWDKNTLNIEESLRNTDKFVAKELKFNTRDELLDAGCGVGGSAIYIARNFGSKVIGINLSQEQIDIANKKIKKEKLSKRVRIIKGDYSETQFGDSTFSKIYAIESVYHVEDVRKFAKEAYRILKAGGKLMIVDRFLSRKRISLLQAKSRKIFMEGQAVKDLPEISNLKRELKLAGFKKIKVINKYEEVKESICRSTRIAKLTYPVNKVLTYLKILPNESLEHSKSLIEIEKLFNEGVITYCAFVVQK